MDVAILHNHTNTITYIPCLYSGLQPFGTGDQFHGRQFFHGAAMVRMVSGWFEHITSIEHFISIIITSAPPRSIRHWISEVGDSCFTIFYGLQSSHRCCYTQEERIILGCENQEVGWQSHLGLLLPACYSKALESSPIRGAWSGGRRRNMKKPSSNTNINYKALKIISFCLL